MARGGRVQHWKHGWIPISPEARAFAAGLGPNPTTGRLPSAALALRGYDDLSPSLQGKINAKLEELTGLPEPELAAKVQANLARLARQGDPAQAEWYWNEGEDISRRAAGVRRDFPGSTLTQEQLTGMIAVTSAQKRWAENKSFAEEIARKLAADQPFPVSQTMVDDYNAWAVKRHAGLAKPHDLKPGTYRPSELPVDFAASKTPGMPKHLNSDYAIRAAQIYRGEASLDEVIGGPKQRSFVNNLMDPADKRFVTVDTWHYRAAMQGIPITRTVGPKGKQQTFSYTLEQWGDRDLSTRDGRAAARGFDPTQDRYSPKNLAATILAADAMSPQSIFQGSPSSVAEKYRPGNGTYPWFVKQTQIVADQLGMSPDGLQSVAWYAVGGGA